MRKLAIVVFLAIALPSVSFAGANVATLERLVANLSRSLEGLEGLAADARAASGAAKEEALVKGRAELARLDPVFQEARQEAERLQQQESTEKWRERIDHAGDLVEAYKKAQELKALETERDRLKEELCGLPDYFKYNGGPRDYFQYNGDSLCSLRTDAGN